MTDNELLLAISDLMDQKLQTELTPLKDDVRTLKDDVQGLKDDVKTLKGDVQTLKDNMQNLEKRTSRIELMLENETNHNLQLLAENHINLVDKLNQAIKVQDKSILYEVQVSGLKCRMDVLERELKELKDKIA